MNLLFRNQDVRFARRPNFVIISHLRRNVNLLGVVYYKYVSRKLFAMVVFTGVVGLF